MPDSPANVLQSKVDATSERFEKNMRAMADRVAAIHNEEEEIREGGGADNIEKQHKKKDRKSTRLNSSHIQKSRMPSSA